MSKIPQYKQRGYKLPENVNADTVCICVDVPCDPNHAQAFLGQLEMLGYWYTWERDAAKTGTLAARAWREIAACARQQLNDKGVFSMAGCGCGCDDDNNRYRYDADGNLEISTDDGATWTPAPQDDYRLNPVLIFPPLTGGTDTVKRCRGANSVVSGLIQLQLEQLALKQTAAGGAEFATSVVAFLIALGLITGGLTIALAVFTTAIAAFFAAHTAAEFEAAFEGTIWDDLLCSAYCWIDENGTYTQETALRVALEVLTVENPIAGQWLYDTISMLGGAGMTNLARAGYSGTRDCTLCDCSSAWCHYFDFSTGQQGWELKESAETFYGVYEPGVGWIPTDNVQDGDPPAGNRQVRIAVPFTSTNITRVIVNFDYVGGVFGNSNLTAHGIVADGVLKFNRTRNNTIDANDQQIEWTDAGTFCTEIEVYLRSSQDTTVPYAYSGSAVINYIVIEGTGINPFVDDNCEEIP